MSPEYASTQVNLRMKSSAPELGHHWVNHESGLAGKNQKRNLAIAQRSTSRELQSKGKPALSAFNQGYAGSYHRDTLDGGRLSESRGTASEGSATNSERRY
jgi:hypothetical protein